MVINSADKKKGNTGFSLKDLVLPFVLGAIYLLCAVRYYPQRPRDTLVATVEHLMVSIPFSLGLTLFVMSVLVRVSREKPSKLFMVRLFFTFGIVIEFFFGLYHYLAVG